MHCCYEKYFVSRIYRKKFEQNINICELSITLCYKFRTQCCNFELLSVVRIDVTNRRIKLKAKVMDKGLKKRKKHEKVFFTSCGGTPRVMVRRSTF